MRGYNYTAWRGRELPLNSINPKFLFLYTSLLGMAVCAAFAYGAVQGIWAFGLLTLVVLFLS